MKKIGNVSYYDSQNQGYGFTKPYSEETAKIIDQEIKKIIDSQYKRAQSILKKHEDKLHQLANKLLETEVIFKEDLEIIFGKRPFEKEVTQKKETIDEAIDETKKSQVIKTETTTKSSKKSA
jgi:cell division protease FtsH